VRVNEIQIAEVNQAIEEVAQDKDRIGFVKRVSQGHQATDDAHVPERHGNDALFGDFAGDPLHDEASGEYRLSEKSQNEPETKFVR